MQLSKEYERRKRQILVFPFHLLRLFSSLFLILFFFKYPTGSFLFIWSSLYSHLLTPLPFFPHPLLSSPPSHSPSFHSPRVLGLLLFASTTSRVAICNVVTATPSTHVERRNSHKTFIIEKAEQKTGERGKGRGGGMGGGANGKWDSEREGNDAEKIQYSHGYMSKGQRTLSLSLYVFFTMRIW